MEEKGERALAGKGKPDSPRLNRIVATQFDKINERLIQIKNQIVGNFYEFRKNDHASAETQ